MNSEFNSNQNLKKRTERGSNTIVVGQPDQLYVHHDRIIIFCRDTDAQKVSQKPFIVYRSSIETIGPIDKAAEIMLTSGRSIEFLFTSDDALDAFLSACDAVNFPPMQETTDPQHLLPNFHQLEPEAAGGLKILHSIATALNPPQASMVLQRNDDDRWYASMRILNMAEPAGEDKDV